MHRFTDRPGTRARALRAAVVLAGLVVPQVLLFGPAWGAAAWWSGWRAKQENSA